MRWLAGREPTLLGKNELSEKSKHVFKITRNNLKLLGEERVCLIFLVFML